MESDEEIELMDGVDKVMAEDEPVESGTKGKKKGNKLKEEEDMGRIDGGPTGQGQGVRGGKKEEEAWKGRGQESPGEALSYEGSDAWAGKG